MDRAIRLSEQVLGQLAGRMRLLGMAARLRGSRPDEAAAALVRLPDKDRAAVRAIAHRCQLDREAAMSVQLVLDQFAEAMQYLEACRRGVPAPEPAVISPAVLQAKVAPLLRLQQLFGHDPVMARVLLHGTAQPAPTGPLRPPRHTGNLARAFPGSAFDPGALERATRAVNLAESFVTRHGPAIRMVRSAVSLGTTGKCAEFLGFAPPHQQLVRRLAGTCDAQTQKRMSVAVHQFQQACEAIRHARANLVRAKATAGPEASNAVADVRPEHLKGLVMPLANYPLTFRGHPILGRLFPDRLAGPLPL